MLVRVDARGKHLLPCVHRSSRLVVVVIPTQNGHGVTSVDPVNVVRMFLMALLRPTHLSSGALLYSRSRSS